MTSNCGEAALKELVFGGAEDAEELCRGLGGNEVLANVSVGEETAHGGESLEVRTDGIARAHDEDEQVYRFAVKGLEIEALFDGGGDHAHAVDVVNLGVRDGKSATDARGTALFARPDGFEDFVTVFKFVGAAKSINQFVKNGFLSFAGRVNQDAIIYKSFRKSHDL